VRARCLRGGAHAAVGSIGSTSTIVETHERLIENLSNMPLESDEVRRARDTASTPTARSWSRGAARPRAGGDRGLSRESEIPPTKRVRIERDLAGSNRAIQRSAAVPALRTTGV
jgi:hypothetical protein